MKGNRKYRYSKFNKLLLANNITVADLCRYSIENETELGFTIDENILGAVVNHSRDVNKTSVDRGLILLNAYTGKEYTYNDILETFSFK